jgi:UV DNA damage endonuclease
MNNLGICCIVNEMRDVGVYTSRTLIKRTFNMEKAAALALQNVTDLITILNWCVDNGVKVFRVGSDFFPRMTEVKYKLSDLSTHREIVSIFAECGKIAHNNGIKLSCHPGPFTILSSPREKVNDCGIDEVEMHSLIGDLLCQHAPLDFTINFHINSTYGGDYDGTSKRFIHNFMRLSQDAQKRVVLENDDRKAGYSVRDYYKYIYQHLGIPITFDIHHWLFKHDDATMYDDYILSKSTWNGRSNQVHYSQSPSADKLIPAHSEMYRDPMPEYISSDADCHIHLEAKGKEKAYFDYINKFCKVNK